MENVNVVFAKYNEDKALKTMIDDVDIKSFNDLLTADVFTVFANDARLALEIAHKVQSETKFAGVPQQGELNADKGIRHFVRVWKRPPSTSDVSRYFDL